MHPASQRRATSRSILCALLASVPGTPLVANPGGGSVIAGEATIDQSSAR